MISKSDLAKIEMVAFDFDGVFTDNFVYTDQKGVETVRCCRADGIGLAKLKKIGIEYMVISAEENPIVEKRCSKLKISCIHGCENKLSVLKELLTGRNIFPENACYVGNDLPDLECMEYVGFPIAVSGTSYPEVLKVAKFITIVEGGKGAVREICDMLYNAHIKK